MSLEDERKQIIEILDTLKRDYERACEPWIRRLVQIEAIQLPRIKIMVDPDLPPEAFYITQKKEY